MTVFTKVDREVVRGARKHIKTAHFAMHIGSISAAVEALEQILVEKGVLQPDELMERLGKVLESHYAKGELIPASND
jgi:hypothetical protein